MYRTGPRLFWPIILVVIGALVLHSAFARPKLDGDVDDWDMAS